ncbi:ankyrin repeat domain-containing protein [Aliiroseovarius sp. CAU 1755]
MFSGQLDDQGRTIPADRPRYDQNDFLAMAYRGQTDDVLAALRGGADIAMTDEGTGLNALHLAVGTNNLRLTKALVEDHDPVFAADKFGRWPSLIAIECEVSDELSDYIVEAEAKFLGLSDQA